jgi:hypothetical protein
LVFGGDGNVWKDKDIKNLHKVHFDKLLLTLKQSHLAHVLYSNSDKLLALFVGLNFIRVNELPHILEHHIAELFEVFSEFEGIKINQRYNFASSFHDFIRHFGELRVVLLQNEHT